MNKNKQNTFERTVSITELCWRLLEQWKMVVCFVVVVTALFLMFMHWRYSDQAKAVRDQYVANKQKTVTDIINELPKGEQNAVMHAYTFSQQLLTSEGYISESRLMRTDPYHTRRFRTGWVITETAEQKSELSQSYLLYISSDEFCQVLLPSFGENADVEQVREAITCSFPAEELNGVFCCEVLLYDGVDEETLKEEFPKAMDNARIKLNTEVGNHQLRCTNQEIITGVDKQLAEYQKAVYERSSYIRGRIKSITDEFSKEQRIVYNKLLGQDKGGTVDVPVVGKTITLRNILIGLLLGAVLYAGGFFLYTILSSKVCGDTDFEEMGIYTLGQWYQKPLKEKAFITDRFIYCCHHKNHMDKEAEVCQTVNAILNACRKDGEKLIFAVTKVLSTEQDGFLYQVKKNLESSDVSVDLVVIDNDQNLFNMHSVSDIGEVVLVAVDKKSLYKKIDLIINQCNYFNVSILGGILLG